MENKGLVFDIQRFSVHDGPGIRTLVFLKGCSLHCKWCSNPDGISFEPQIRYRKVTCVGCGKCLGCPEGAVSLVDGHGFVIDREKCTRCGECVEKCVPKSKFWSGDWKTVDELYNIVKRDRPFFDTDGGVTLGGGDPMMQSDFAAAFLQKCRDNGITTAIETAGNYEFNRLEKAAPLCDTIFFDIKGWDEQRHKDCTGSGNQLILENLKKLDRLIMRLEKKPVLIVRIPLIPNFNITQNDMVCIAQFVIRLHNVDHVEVLPFHNLGLDKYEQLNLDYVFRDATNLHSADVEDYSLILGRNGVRHKVISW